MNGYHSIVAVDQAKASVQITNPESSDAPLTHSFAYDAAFQDEGSYTTVHQQQRDIYDQEVAMVVTDVLNGKVKVWI